MKAADFTKLKTLWTDSGKTTYTPAAGFEGDVYMDNMVSGTLAGTATRVGTLVTESKTAAGGRGYAPFSRFTCGAVAAQYQYCYKYQLRDFESEWSDGNVRFEKSQKVTTYLLNSRGWEAQYSIFSATTILLGG